MFLSTRSEAALYTIKRLWNIKSLCIRCAMTMCKLALSKRAGRAPVVRATEKVGMERGRKEGRKEAAFVGFTCDRISAVCCVNPSSFLFEGLPSSVGAPLQCNWLWQPHTWQQWGRWRGSFEHCCVVLQRGDRTRAGGCESPRACDWWYGSVSEPICHICPCHFASVRWLLWPHEEHT